ALMCFNKLLEFDPNDAEYWNMKGVSLVSLGRYSEAIRCFERSLEIDPTREIVSNNKIYALNKLTESSGHMRLGNKHEDNKKIKYYSSAGKPVYE
ncbi:MAG: tetratricopeptide repeat protein, partial [Thermoproteota archaeon]|nr:tetratricopeptide repeat protein [Thermoproteota archaeon]